MRIAIVARLASLMARSGLGDPRLGRDIPKLNPKLDPPWAMAHGYPDASRKTSGLASLAEHACDGLSSTSSSPLIQRTRATRRGAIRTILSLIPTARFNAASAHRRTFIAAPNDQHLNSALRGRTKAEETRRAHAKA
jgi:hypothetical protein